MSISYLEMVQLESRFRQIFETFQFCLIDERSRFYKTVEIVQYGLIGGSRFCLALGIVKFRTIDEKEAIFSICRSPIWSD